LYFVGCADKNFGIATFTRAAKFLELRTKALSLRRENFEIVYKCPEFAPRRDNFGIETKSTGFCSAAQRKNFVLQTKALLFVRP
jgi:hypothetical protein